jgi:predicted phosphohydrolase
MATSSVPIFLPKSRNIFYPPPPTAWERFKQNPTFFLTKYLYNLSQSTLLPMPPSTQHPPIRIVCISDTHNTTPDVPDGDILLHAGDMTNSGSFDELQAQINWLNSLSHKYKVCIAGNHDLLLDADFVARMPPNIPSLGGSASDLNWGSVVYLQNTATTLAVNGREINIFGKPDTPRYGNWAFQHPASTDTWTGTIPPATDILLTHGPPRGHLDLNRKGCTWLQKELWRVRPRLCVFGHVHEGRGREEVSWDHVQSVFDEECRGERGWLGVLEMVVAVVWGIGKRRRERTTLINAAVAWEGDTEVDWRSSAIEI